MSDRLEILVSAYACDPARGSEQGVGWGWVRALSALHELTVITTSSGRESIEAHVAATGECVNVRFEYVPRTRFPRLEAVWPPAYLWSYRLWLRDVHRIARELTASERFDVVHQLTYVGFRVPGHLWKLGLPFVWGPIGGLENTRTRLLPMLGFRGALYHVCRSGINTLHKWLLPGPKRAFRAARGGIVAATSGMRDEIRRWYGEESTVICEVGPPGAVSDAPTRREPGEPLRLVWSGLHLPGKALPALLEALRSVSAGVDWSLTILGSGPCTDRWRARAQAWGLDGRCTWTGWVSRAEALRVMAASHLAVITSVKELTSTVLLEALSEGLPVVCADHCGFRDVVTSECGVRLPIPTPRAFVAGLTSSIETLARDEGLRSRLAWGALARAREFGWEEKARQVDGIYRHVVVRSRGDDGGGR